ncbi:MAG: N-acetylmuramoyl-L-alanine amidase [Gemmatimonadaceae bacterium]
MSARARVLLAASALVLLSPAASPAASAAASANAPPGDVIRVKGVAGDTVVTLVPTPAGGMVSLELMARLLGGTVEPSGTGQWRLALYGAAIDLHAGTPFAGYNGFVLPLLEATRVVDGAPYVTLQLFSEIIPRFGIGILWDRTRWEVRLFQGIARRTGPVVAERLAAATPVSAVSAVSATGTAGAVVPLSSAPRRPGANGLYRSYTVAVDAGHGGNDPGNPGVVLDGRRVNESRLTLAIALKLEHALRTRGVNVVMTRRTDTLVARDDRGRIANARKADLFVSIHTNAANPAWRNGSAVRGFETYYLSTARTEDERRVAEMENDVVRFETATEVEKGDPLSFILNDLAQNEHLRESSDLAQVIQNRLEAPHPGPNRGVKQAGFAVLARAYMPAVLVEVGFGTNPAEARWMASNAGQQALALAIADAVVEYLQHYERRTRAAP